MIDTLIFDLGGVLIDWNPQYLYRKIFTNDDEMHQFLDTICTPDWNEEQDAGRLIKQGTELLIAEHPEKESHIRAFYERWDEMLGGEISGTVEILRELKESKRYKLYALTNWSAETFPIAFARYGFLSWFDGIVVSGTEKIRKPSHEFYKLLLDRYHVPAGNALFIDDNLRNIKAAQGLGITSVQFISADKLRLELTENGILNS